VGDTATSPVPEGESNIHSGRRCLKIQTSTAGPMPNQVGMHAAGEQVPQRNSVQLYCLAEQAPALSCCRPRGGADTDSIPLAISTSAPESCISPVEALRASVV